MSDPFMSMISMNGMSWAPVDYALCNGAVMQITEHQALFALMGNAFGGNARTTFNLPDFRSRTPVGTGTSTQDGNVYNRGAIGGFENVTLTQSTAPAHRHDVSCMSVQGTTSNLQGDAYAQPQFNGAPLTAYTSSVANIVEFNPAALPTSAGGSQSHYNIQPYQVINFIIAISGAFPSRN